MTKDEEKRIRDWATSPTTTLYQDVQEDQRALLTEIDSLRKQLSETEFAIAGDFHLRCNAEIYNRDERIRELEQRAESQNLYTQSIELATTEIQRRRDELEQQLKAAQSELEHFREETCKCGHSRRAHSGHGHVIGSPAPDHCAVACIQNCNHFDPVRASLKAAQERLAEALKKYPSIAIDTDTCGGAPRLSGTRIPVVRILEALHEYKSIESVSKRAFKSLTVDQIEDAIGFAAELIEEYFAKHSPSSGTKEQGNG